MPTRFVGIVAAASWLTRWGSRGHVLPAVFALACTLGLPSPAVASLDLQGQQQATLTVSIIGRGRVVSVPPGTACITTGGGLRTTLSCSFNVGETVVLTSVPAAGWKTDSWADCDSAADSACTVAIPPGGRTVNAQFIPTGILRIWTGQVGVVSVRPAGINGRVTGQRRCRFTVEGNGPPCTLRYPIGTRVKLLAVPEPGSSFFRWSEFCVRANPCTVTARRDTTECCGTSLDVVATFSPVRLTVYRGDDLGEHGIVTSSPSGMHCPDLVSNCSGVFSAGRLVTLIAAPAGAVHWGFDEPGFGCVPAGGDPTSTTCVMRAYDLFAGVSFGAAAPPPYPFDPVKRVRVRRGGNKQGGITGPSGTNGGIHCGLGAGDCSEWYHHGDHITLVATAKAGSVFRRWRYVPCLGSRQSRFCSFKVGASASAQAIFRPRR